MATLRFRMMRTFLLFASCAVLSTVSSLPASAADPSESLITRPGLESTNWLADNIGQPNLRIIDARQSLGAYLKEHIPGAVYLNPESLRLATGGTPGKLLPPADLARIFSRIGISTQSPVVVYSQAEDSFAAATYVAKALEYLGNPHVAVLDGGIDKWQEEGRPLTKEFPRLAEGSFVPSVQSQMLRTAQETSEAARAKSVVVVDARSPQQHASGHIPNSANLPLHDLLTSGSTPTWKSVGDIRKRAAEAGITANTPVITYCNSGRSASQLAFTLSDVLGLKNVSVYDGSMVDWTAQGMPTEAAQTTSTQAR